METENNEEYNPLQTNEQVDMGNLNLNMNNISDSNTFNSNSDDLEVIDQNDLNDSKSIENNDEATIDQNEEEDNDDILDDDGSRISSLKIDDQRYNKTKKKRNNKKLESVLQRVDHSRQKTRLNTLFSLTPSKKTIFSTITEKAYTQYLKNNESKPNLFNDLVSEQYIMKELERKECTKEIITKMLDRQNEYNEKRQNNLQRQREESQNEISAKCKWIPVKRISKCNNSLIKTHLENNKQTPKGKRVNSFNRLMNKKNDNNNNESNVNNKCSQVIPIPHTKKKKKKSLTQNNTNDDDGNNNNVWFRLNNRVIHNWKIKSNSKKEIGIKRKIKEEDKLFIDRLSKSRTNINNTNTSGTSSSNKQPVLLLSLSSKKLLLDKFVGLFNQSMMNLFNKAGNALLNYDECKALMAEVCCIDKEKGINKLEESLINNAYKSYLHVVNDTVETNWILLFFLSCLGIYTNDINTEENGNTSWIKKQLPDINHQQYNYEPSTVQTIKATFKQLGNNVRSKWQNQSIEKRKAKITTLYNTHNNSREKTGKSNVIVVSKQNKNSAIIERISLTPDIKKDINYKAKTIEDISHNNVIYCKSKQNKIILLQKIKEEELAKECIFQPNSHKKRTKNSIGTFEKLYIDSKVRSKAKEKCPRYNNKMEDAFPGLNDADDELVSPFSPSITQLNPKLFDSNPLEKDEKLNKALQRLEIYKQNKNNRNNHSSPLQNNSGKTFEQPAMHFELEIKTYKDKL